jgi:DNA-binding CsgD family transcriptional regulator
MPPHWPLVGRDVELAQVAESMDAHAAGVLLAGPPGVGKTRLATEAAALAGDRGWRTAVVRANRSAATIPFGAFAPLLPAVAASNAEGQADALRAARDALIAASGECPLLLVVDDAQELDDASAALLPLLTTAPGVFLVVTVRTADPQTPLATSAPEALTSLWKDELLTRIDLPGLSAAAADELVSQVLGNPVDGVTAKTLWTTSGGNALFLRELVLGALDAGTLQESGGMWRLRGGLSPSTRLGEVVGLRLGALDEDDRHALEVVSVGEPVGIADLEALAPPGTIDALERRGLLDVVVEGNRHQVRMAHPLYGEVVRAGLPARRHQEVCRALAEQVESRGARRREDTLRVAIWRLDSGGGGRPELLVDGAQQAIFAFDLKLAERLARAAWMTNPTATCGRLLGETLDGLGRHNEAEEVMSAARELATNDRDRALVTLARSSNLFRGLGHSAQAEALLIDAEQSIDDADLRDELRAQQAVHLLFEGRLAETLTIARPLLERPGDRAFVHGALPGAVAAAIAGRTMEAIDIADRAFEARVALGDQVQMSGPGIYLVARSIALLEAGRLAEAGENARLGYDGATERQLADGQAWFAVTLGRVALAQGRVQTAARWFREGALVFGDVGHPGARWGYGGLAHCLALVGDLDGADAALADLDAEPPTPVRMMDPDVERARVWVLVQRSEYTLARGLLRRIAEDAAGTGRYALESAALHDLARLGEPEDAVARLSALTLITDGDFIPARAAHAQALADRDGDALEDVVGRFENIGALLIAAEAARSAQRSFRRDGLARRASEIGVRAARFAEACEGASTPGLAADSETTPLTRREREVAELAGRGSTSREIAEKLFVSTRTVENHLQRAYEKLGVRGRVELAEALGSDT